MRQYQLSKLGMLSKSQSKFVIKKNQEKLEKIQRLETNRLTSNYKVFSKNGWHLAGFDEPKKDCGKWKSKGCLNVEHHPKGKAWVKHYRNCCFRSSCSRCVWTWCDREANRASQRFDNLNMYASNFFGNGFRYNPIHIVVSVPKKDWELEYEEMKKKAIWILKRVNCYGGMLIFHTCRQHDEPEKCNCSELSCVKGDWYWSPHWHVVGVGYIIGSEVKDTYDKTEWIVRNLGVRKSVFKTVWYLLCHCGIKESKKHNYHAVTWFGILGYHSYYSKLITQYEVDDTDFCPFCYEKLHLLIWCGSHEPPPDEEIEHLEGLNSWEYHSPLLEGMRKRGELFD